MVQKHLKDQSNKQIRHQNQRSRNLGTVSQITPVEGVLFIPYTTLSARKKELNKVEDLVNLSKLKTRLDL